MSGDENRGAEQRIVDGTDVDFENEADRNSVAPEVDRKAFNPRGKLKAARNVGVPVMLAAAGFLGFLSYSIASKQQEEPETIDDSTFALTGEEEGDRKAPPASIVVSQDGLTQVGTDPFGNPIMGDGSDLSVPGPSGYPNGADPNSAIAQRLERERQARIEAAERRRAIYEAQMTAPVMAVSGGGGVGGVLGNLTGGGTAQQPSSAGPFSNLTVGQVDENGDPIVQAEAPNALRQRMTPSTVSRVNASKIGNRNFLVLAGGQIPCVLQTAMDSTQPGYTSCIIPTNVWSANGNVILMEKGTRVLGEYRGGFQRGENRIFVLWTRAVTPAGISVSLTSPAADQLGRAGMGGNVDTFFFERFGAALLLSIVGDAGSALADNISGADQTIRAPNTAAQGAVQDGAQIRPRLRAPQGKEMTIMVAQDVDFSGVYSLRLRP